MTEALHGARGDTPKEEGEANLREGYRCKRSQLCSRHEVERLQQEGIEVSIHSRALLDGPDTHPDVRAVAGESGDETGSVA